MPIRRRNQDLNIPRAPLAQSLYVILDIRDDSSDAEQTAGLAERRGEDVPFQCGSTGRSGISTAQIAEWRESRFAAFAADAIDRLAMPLAPDQ